MIGAKLGITLALIAALGVAGWLLRAEIRKNGELSEQLAQQAAATQRAEQATAALQLEIIERDEAVQLLEAKLNEHNQRTESVRTVVRKVYVQPDAEPWAKTEPPPAVAAAVAAGIDCLWQHDGNQNCGDLTTGGNDG